MPIKPIPLVKQSSESLSGQCYLLSLCLSSSKLSSYSECCLVLAQTPGCYTLFIELLSKHQWKQVSPVCVLWYRKQISLFTPSVYTVHRLSLFTLSKLFMYSKSQYIYSSVCVCALTLISVPGEIEEVILPFLRETGWGGSKSPRE